jgi:hypothetical protein
VNHLNNKTFLHPLPADTNMPLYQKIAEGLDEVDVIIAGGAYLFNRSQCQVNVSQ